jgi:hypothetical protein
MIRYCETCYQCQYKEILLLDWWEVVKHIWNFRKKHKQMLLDKLATLY